jgi:signal transduction histidine kinase
VIPSVRRSDVVLTSVLLAVSLVQVLVAPIAPRPLGVLYAVAFVAPVAWRWTRPATAALALGTVFLAPVDGFLVVGFVAVILVFYSLGVRGQSDVRDGLVCAWALACGTIGTLLGPEDPVAGVLSTWLATLAPYLFGRLTASQRAQAERRHREERAAARQAAIAEERARIVRELHDVVGHEVTLMSIQSEAAAMALAQAPERAVEPITAMRETAHRASRELRAILDLLGEGDLPVIPDNRGLAELVDRANRLGIPCTLRTRGTPWLDAPQHWLAVNRIVQECLTNAGRHAPGAAVDADVTWQTDSVDVRVANATTPGSWQPGRGIDGMNERARSLGGTLVADLEHGQFVVSAALPLTKEAS